MKKKRAPAYQWYPGDWALDELASALPNEAYGLFRRLYDVAWLNDGLPAEDDKLFAYSRCGENRKRFDQLWMSISALFPPDDTGRRRNPQQEEERKKQRKNSRVKQFAAKTRWAMVHSRRNAHASAPAVQTDAMCNALHFALSLSLSDQDQEQEEQRDTDRRAPRPGVEIYDRQGRLVETATRLPRMAKSVYDVRGHLFAAAYRLMESGPPYLGADGQPDEGVLCEQLKQIAAHDLNASWDHSSEIARIVHAAIATRSNAAANAAYQASVRRRDRQALRQTMSGRRALKELKAGGDR